MSSPGVQPGFAPDLPDAAERAAALDPGRSFLVQAPAGSGKTDLLIRRFLTLLALADEPEGVLAVTFTRKAAAEMRQRLLEALAPEGEARDDHERSLRELAQRVRDRDRVRQWNLLEQPARLRVETLDALAARLAARMPWLSRFGPAPRPTTEAEPLYRQAARNALADRHPAALHLLAAYHADCARLEDWIASLLGRRDQWLDLVTEASGRPNLRAELEDEMQRLRSRLMVNARDGLQGAGLASFIPSEARESAGNLSAAGKASAITACGELRGLPPVTEAGWEAWLGIVELLLVADKPQQRRNLDVNIGFLAGAKHKGRKDRFKATVALDPELRARLHALRTAPPAAFGHDEWAILEALFAVLPRADRELRRVFARAGEVDFIALADAARTALGSDELPSDLAFALDGSLRHLLVDEFQDTSHAQLALLTALVRDWQPENQTSVFLVGDPMQSLYGFRNADVRQFLDLWKARRLGGLALETLTLKSNFRSRPGLVAWCNHAFEQAIAANPDAAGPGLPFAPGFSPALETPGPDVIVRALPADDDRIEADLVREMVEFERAALSSGKQDPENAKPEIAILVASRRHAAAILVALQRAGTGFDAAHFLSLDASPVVQDLLALTRALLHPADRVAWLALLRAAWCGLTLADLHALCHDAGSDCLWDLLHHPARQAALSPDGRTRAAGLVAALRPAFDQRCRAPLRALVETCWLRLGGPDCIADAGHATHPAAFFQLLERYDAESGGGVFDRLESDAAALFLPAPPPAPAGTDTRVQVRVLTMHAAKGLQFDTVILPGLARRTRADDSRLFLWDEPERGHLLLAAAPPRGAAPGAYAWLNGAEKTRRRQEQLRQLYVAATRAQRRLYLLAQVSGDIPNATSPLARIWPAVQAQFEASISSAARAAPAPQVAPRLRRAPAGWQPTPPRSEVAWTAPPPPRPTAVAAHAGLPPRAIGTAVHALLHRMARRRETTWEPARLETLLRASGLAAAQMREATAQATRALEATLAHEKGRWILASHPDADSELELAGRLDGELRHGILDRTFRDEQGVRWVVDYKTDSRLDPARLDEYRRQLDIYAALLARLHDETPESIRRGLLFPLAPDWIEW